VASNLGITKGQRVEVVVTGAHAEAGEQGTVTGLKGWNVWQGRKVGRWVEVSIDRDVAGRQRQKKTIVSSHELAVIGRG
jgi:hypothetical protein